MVTKDSNGIGKMIYRPMTLVGVNPHTQCRVVGVMLQNLVHKENGILMTPNVTNFALEDVSLVNL